MIKKSKIEDMGIDFLLEKIIIKVFLGLKLRLQVLRHSASLQNYLLSIDTYFGFVSMLESSANPKPANETR